MLKSISLRNILSFGPGGMDLRLNSINVLIGPNGCGKSNLIVQLLSADIRHEY